MTQSVPEEADVDLLQVCRRNFGKMFIAFTLVFAVSVAYFVLAKRLYTAEARLFIRLGRETVGLDPTATTNQVISVQDARESEVNSVTQLILSRAVAEEVVDAVGADAILESSPDRSLLSFVNDLIPSPPPNPRDAAIMKIQKRLKVQAVEHSSVITLAYQGASAELSSKVLTAVLASARKAHLRINRIDGSDSFFAEQSARWKQEVDHLEAAMSAFKNGSGISNVARQRELQLNEIAALKIAILENEAQLHATEAQLTKQETLVGAEPEHLVVTKVSDMPNTATEGMRQQLYSVQLKEAELLTKYKPEHPLVKQVREEINSASRMLKHDPLLTQITEGMNQVRQDMRGVMLSQKATVAGLKAKSDILRADVTSAEKEMQTLNNQEPRFEQLTRELDLAQASYRSYYQKHEQARIDRALSNDNISNLNVMQAPSGSGIPTWPQPVLILAIGLVSGMAASVLVAMVAEYRRPAKQMAARPPAAPHRATLLASNGSASTRKDINSP
jgi:polysaccharide biosynthesis protein PslE